MDLKEEFQLLNYQTSPEKWGALQLIEAESTLRISQLPCNIHKNRYRDVPPIGFDGEGSTRVKLASVCGIEGSDFINANLMKLGRKTYISCQAPLPHTIGDFWRMVWEQESVLIVMLTKIVENDRVKAHTYWPAVSQSLVYGCLSITNNSTKEESGVVVRQLQLFNHQTNTGRLITQLQCNDWPDNGAPRSCQSTCHLLQLFRAYRGFHKALQGLEGPAIVHCSAGIGRSGTFIAIDIMLDRLLESQRVRDGEEANDGESNSSPPPKTVFDTVCWLRLRRKGMIQSLDQYKFIYRVLEEFHPTLSDSEDEDEDEKVQVLTSHLISCSC